MVQVRHDLFQNHTKTLYEQNILLLEDLLLCVPLLLLTIYVELGTIIETGTEWTVTRLAATLF